MVRISVVEASEKKLKPIGADAFVIKTTTWIPLAGRPTRHIDILQNKASNVESL